MSTSQNILFNFFNLSFLVPLIIHKPLFYKKKGAINMWAVDKAEIFDS